MALLMGPAYSFHSSKWNLRGFVGDDFTPWGSKLLDAVGGQPEGNEDPTIEGFAV